MLDIYANQKIGWRRKTGADSFGTAIRDAPETISARVEHKRHTIRNAKGQEVVSQAYVMTAHKVGLDDVLVIEGREWPVVAANAVTGLMGEELFREVWL